MNQQFLVGVRGPLSEHTPADGDHEISTIIFLSERSSNVPYSAQRLDRFGLEM